MSGNVVPPEVVEVHRQRRELDQRIGLLSAQIHALGAELVDAVAAYDTADGWQGGGWRTLSQWLSVRTGFAVPEAQRIASVAQRVNDLPNLMADARSGKFSVAVVASAARIVTPENEARVADIVRTCTPAQSSRVLAAYRTVAPRPTPETSDSEPGESEPDNTQPQAGPLDPPTPSPDELWWRTWTDERGRYRIDGALDRITGELMEQARLAARAGLERSRPAGAVSGAESGAESCTEAGAADAGRVTDADSISALASAALDNATRRGIRDRGGERFSIQVSCDLETLAHALGIELDPHRPVRLGARAYLCRTGAHLSDTELASIAERAGVQLLVDHHGQPLWLGNATRLFNNAQRRAFTHRAGGAVASCEFPGCTVKRHVEAHHIAGVHDDGGPTDLTNGAHLCSFHHHQLHRSKWRIERSGTQLVFWDGDRCLGSSGPPGPAPGPPPDIAHRPRVTALPEAPAHFTPTTSQAPGGADRLTYWALDTLVAHLLAA